MKNILVSDFDSTLYTDLENMKINVLKIKEFRKRKNLFVIATGRFFSSLIKKIDEFGIETDYLILNNGSVILDKDYNLIKYYEIKKKDALNLLNDLKDFKTINETIIFDIFSTVSKIDETNEITKISLILNSLLEVSKITEIINKKYKDLKCYLIIHNFINLEIINKTTDKSIAVTDILQIEKESNVFVIGDGNNDVEMIKKFNGFAIENSKEEISNLAKKIYPNVHNLIDDII